MGVYLKNFETFTDPNDNLKIKVHYRIEYNNRLTLNKIVDVPDSTNKASGNITIVFDLVPNSAVPTATAQLEEFVDAHLTKDWHTMPQPHRITFILVHDKGFDEDSMSTSDPT